MYILPLIIIALCPYTSISADDKKTPVVLDINTRESTDRVNVSKTEDNEMVTYKIEPKNKAKIESFTDGGIIIYQPKDGEKYKHLEVMCPKATDESIIVVLNYADGLCCGTSGYYYFRYDKIWRRMTSGLHAFVVDKMKKGEPFNRDTVVYRYYSHHNQIVRTPVTVDISNETAETKDTSVTWVNIKEDGVDTRIYTVDKNSVISEVKFGDSSIWKKNDDVYGCYNIKMYHLKSQMLLILVVRDPRKTELLFYKKEDGNKFSSIVKSDFDHKLKELKGPNWSESSDQNYLDGLSFTI